MAGRSCCIVNRLMAASGLSNLADDAIFQLLRGCAEAAIRPTAHDTGDGRPQRGGNAVDAQASDADLEH